MGSRLAKTICQFYDCNLFNFSRKFDVNFMYSFDQIRLHAGLVSYFMYKCFPSPVMVSFMSPYLIENQQSIISSYWHPIKVSDQHWFKKLSFTLKSALLSLVHQQFQQMKNFSLICCSSLIFPLKQERQKIVVH